MYKTNDESSTKNMILLLSYIRSQVKMKYKEAEPWIKEIGLDFEEAGATPENT
jgi:hypothetical protein